ncbi:MULTISPECIES: hypothetical protein [unclassified Streptomyces]|uniref:hypothetical protein n=1 Tax=unclassified Streptomyces TaxID=2593676 RepID=UPI00225BA647|nr:MULTISPECIES: hypothetical protein [unclassified Streptomyces]MCX5435278.1 hypothetical protein [Streptomyces sp. NBC_00063]WSE13118.1 hypothetical protein OG518_07230 [Streptomyces sp. NBC_01397]WUB97956.1 hypothetical protein OHO83_39720 [Streptomyces sp. NBC_00569]
MRPYASAPRQGPSLIWHELDTGVRRSIEQGALRQGADVLEHLGHRIDDETTQSALSASGLS